MSAPVRLLPAAFLTLTALAACDGEATEAPFLHETTPTTVPTATATPTAAPSTTPTPAPETGGLDGFRVFANLIADAIGRQDGTILADRAYPEMLYSQGDVVGSTDPDHVREHFERLVSEARADNTDEFGTGAANLYALAVASNDPYYSQPPFEAQPPHQAIITAIMHDPWSGPYRRTLVVYEFVYRPGQWRLAGVTIDPGLSDTTLSDWLSGTCERCRGDILWTRWERWQGAAK